MNISDWIKSARKAARLTQAQLGEALGRTKGNVSAWERGAHEPSYQQMLMIAKATGVSSLPSQLQRRQLQGPDYNVSSPAKQRAPVPLISWVQAGDWIETVDTLVADDAEEWLPCPRSHGPRTFALRVRGVSMEDKYKDGSIIFVDPDKQADHGSNVVVRMEDGKEATFKQLVIEGEKRFLRPLNPNWPDQLIPINGTATICGVVIGQFIPE